MLVGVAALTWITLSDSVVADQVERKHAKFDLKVWRLTYPERTRGKLHWEIFQMSAQPAQPFDSRGADFPASEPVDANWKRKKTPTGLFRWVFSLRRSGEDRISDKAIERRQEILLQVLIEALNIPQDPEAPYDRRLLGVPDS